MRLFVYKPVYFLHYKTQLNCFLMLETWQTPTISSSLMCGMQCAWYSPDDVITISGRRQSVLIVVMNIHTACIKVISISDAQEVRSVTFRNAPHRNTTRNNATQEVACRWMLLRQTLRSFSLAQIALSDLRKCSDRSDLINLRKRTLQITLLFGHAHTVPTTQLNIY